MHVIKVKYRNMEFIIDTNISPRNNHLHKIPSIYLILAYTLILLIPRHLQKKQYFFIRIVSIKLDAIDWPVTNLHDNGVCMNT